MNQDKIANLYLKKDYNCAESTLRLFNENLSLNLNEETLKSIGGFGGGMGCGLTCGALCASISVLSTLLIDQRAHNTKDFKTMCSDYAELFRGQFGDTNCCYLKNKYFDESCRCLKLICENADLLDKYINKITKK